MASTREEGELLESSSSSSEDDSDEEQTTGKGEPSALKFKNDGSFLEMFKKMQDNKCQQSSSASVVPEKKDSTQLKSPEKKDSSSSADKSQAAKKEESPAQKKPGLMSIVSPSPERTISAVVELVKLTFLFQG